SSSGDELPPRNDADDRKVDSDIDDGDGDGADHDRSRNDSTRVLHLVADIADVVVAEVVVDPDAGRGAESKEETQREIERAGREIESDARVEVRRAGQDHCQHRDQRANPERYRDLGDRLNSAIE